MRYEWDRNKADTNLRKHDVAFDDIVRFDWLGARFFADDVFDGEVRSRALGWIGDRLIYVVYVVEDDVCRIVSMRKATRGEYRFYGA